MTRLEEQVTPLDVLEFWFGSNVKAENYQWRTPLWFHGTQEIDDQLKDMFQSAVQDAAEGLLNNWQATPDGSLALILLFDQIPRNIYRGTAKMFENDPAAYEVAQHVLQQGWHLHMSPAEQAFVFMPLQHKEDVESAMESWKLLQELHKTCHGAQRGKVAKLISSAKKHIAVLRAFGRYPHRNSLLGRTCTRDELDFLQTHNYNFMRSVLPHPGTGQPPARWHTTQASLPGQDDVQVAQTAAQAVSNSRAVERMARKQHRHRMRELQAAARERRLNQAQEQACQPRLKLMVLHSFLQNSQSCAQRTKKLRRALEQFAELVYVNAPHIYAPRGEVLEATLVAFGKLPALDHQRMWFTASEDNSVYYGVDESIAYLERVLEQQGPFDGIIGFSQGGAMACLLSALQPHRPALSPLRFIINISGFLSRATAHAGLWAAGDLPMPSLHVLGRTDILVDPARTRAAAAAFRQSVLCEHAGGHWVPNMWPTQDIVAFVEKFRDAVPAPAPPATIPDVVTQPEPNGHVPGVASVDKSAAVGLDWVQHNIWDKLATSPEEVLAALPMLLDHNGGKYEDLLRLADLAAKHCAALQPHQQTAADPPLASNPLDGYHKLFEAAAGLLAAALRQDLAALGGLGAAIRLHRELKEDADATIGTAEGDPEAPVPSGTAEGDLEAPIPSGTAEGGFIVSISSAAAEGDLAAPVPSGTAEGDPTAPTSLSTVAPASHEPALSTPEALPGTTPGTETSATATTGSTDTTSASGKSAAAAADTAAGGWPFATTHAAPAAAAVQPPPALTAHLAQSLQDGDVLSADWYRAAAATPSALAAGGTEPAAVLRPGPEAVAVFAAAAAAAAPDGGGEAVAKLLAKISVCGLALPAIGGSVDRRCRLAKGIARHAFGYSVLSEAELAEARARKPPKEVLESPEEVAKFVCYSKYLRARSALRFLVALRQSVGMARAERRAQRRAEALAMLRTDEPTWRAMQEAPIHEEVIHPKPAPVQVCSVDELQPLLTHLRSNAPLLGDLQHFDRGALVSDGRLDLCKQVVGPTGIGPLLRAMKETMLVKRLLLGNNIVGDSGAALIAEFIRSPQSLLDTWYIAGNAISSVGISAVTTALHGNTQVKALWLKRNPLGPAGMLHIGALLRNNNCLQTLDLVNCGLLDKGAITLMSALRHNSSLRHLYLGSNGITSVGAAAIADHFTSGSNHLDTLFLSCNRLGDYGAAVVARAVAAGHNNNNNSMLRLGLSSNRISPSGAVAVFEALRSHPTLLMLDLGFNKATNALHEVPNRLADEGAAAAADFLRHNSTLRSLDLLHNAISQVGVNQLLDAMRHNTSLTSLHLTQYGKVHNEVAREEIRAICARNKLRVEDQDWLLDIEVPAHVAEIYSVYRTHD